MHLAQADTLVEAPSQLLEEWIYDTAVLRRFARHAQSGEPIPEKLVRDLQAARDFGRALYAQWLVFRSMVSLGLHDRDPHRLDTSQLVFELAQGYLPYELPNGTHFETSFEHLTSYSAAYYTYLWSQAIAKDLLTAFKNGLLDQRETRRYRDLVLAPGGSKPAAELISDFLGRSYTFDALARWLASDSG
jgi:thimet oligopeptidase